VAPLSEVERFAGFFRMLGHELEDFQRLIVEEAFSVRRELLVLLPRACGKSTLLAAISLWELLRGPRQIVVGAASREQASVLFDVARGFTQHPEVAPLVEVTRREIRTADGFLRVIAADGPKQHGLIVDLAIVDELHAHRTDELYVALRTSLQKRRGARMITISTAGARVDTPLGALRDRCLKLPKVKRDGALVRAEGPNLAMLEWALEEGADPDDLDAALACNPASWITREGLAEQRQAVHDLAWRRYHLNVWTGGEAPWILPDEWDANDGTPDIDGPGVKVIGVDAAVSSDTAALALVRKDPEDIFHVVWRVWVPSRRDRVPLADVEEVCREWAQRHQVHAVVYDPRFFEHAAQNLQDQGVPVKEWRYQRNATGASTLHELVSHRRLRHGGADLPRRHALAAEVRDREFGQVISKTKSREHIDSLMALMYAADEAAAAKPPRESVYGQRGLLVM
jgi:phage terminase large subunit-like protein